MGILIIFLEKKNLKASILIGILFLINPSLYAQHDNESKSEAHELKRHRIALEAGYTFIPDAYDEFPGDSYVFVPSIGIEYVYRFSHKWAAGITVNMETGNYLIEFNREDLPRANALIIAAVAIYEVLPRWGVFLGPGIELESHHNFGLIRMGTDYLIPLKNNWDIAPVLTFDHKIDYTSWEIVISVGKSF